MNPWSNDYDFSTLLFFMSEEINQGNEDASSGLGMEIVFSFSPCNFACWLFINFEFRG